MKRKKKCKKLKKNFLKFLFQGHLNPSRLPPSWVSSTHFVFQSDDGGLTLLDTSNFTISLLVTNHTLVSTASAGAQLQQHNLTHSDITIK